MDERKHYYSATVESGFQEVIREQILSSEAQEGRKEEEERIQCGVLETLTGQGCIEDRQVPGQGNNYETTRVLQLSWVPCLVPCKYDLSQLMCVCEYMCVYTHSCPHVCLCCALKSLPPKNIEFIHSSLYLHGWKEILSWQLTSCTQVIFPYHMNSHESENIKKEKKISKSSLILGIMIILYILNKNS